MSKRTLATIFVAGALLLPLLSFAQSASGTLAVTATLQSSISMVFNSNAGGVTLGGAGTNAATLNFGNISAYGTLAANVSRSVGASSFTVSTPFNVEVDKSNSSSPNYALTAQLASADAVNTWALNGTGITNASATTVAASGAYGSPGTAYTLALTVPMSNTAASISNTIDFVATAN